MSLVVVFLILGGCPSTNLRHFEFQLEEKREKRIKIEASNEESSLELRARPRLYGNTYEVRLQTDIYTHARIDEYKVNPDSIRILAGQVRFKKTDFLWGDTLNLKSGKRSLSNLFVFNAQYESLRSVLGNDSSLGITIELDGFLIHNDSPVKFDVVKAFDNKFIF